MWIWSNLLRLLHPIIQKKPWAQSGLERVQWPDPSWRKMPGLVTLVHLSYWTMLSRCFMNAGLILGACFPSNIFQSDDLVPYPNHPPPPTQMIYPCFHKTLMRSQILHKVNLWSRGWGTKKKKKWNASVGKNADIPFSSHEEKAPNRMVTFEYFIHFGFFAQ